MREKFRPALLDWLGGRDEKTLLLNGDIVRHLEDSRQRFFILAGAFCWPGVTCGGGDSDVGDSDIIKLNRGYGNSDVGSSDDSREGGREGGRGRAGDGKVCRKVGTRGL